MNNLQNELEKYIRTAFDNEEAFIERFHFSQKLGLGSLHMACGQCLVGLDNGDQRGYAYRAISTEEYMLWCESIWSKQNDS